MEIRLDSKYLNQLLKEQSRKAAGIIMKRFEVINNRDDLKNAVKELIYENYRDLLTLLILSGENSKQVNWNFKQENGK